MMLSIAVVTLVAFAPTRFALQESRPAATLQSANALMQKGSYVEAAAAFEELVTAQPANGQAWFGLGYSRHALGDMEAALAAHERAAKSPTLAATASYNAACACAMLDRADDAFAWLERARTAGFTNWAGIANDTDLASLLADPRMESFRPVSPSTSQPFAEEVTILHDLYGEGPNAQFGWVARAVGDVDRDGVTDYASTAPFHQGKGAVYIVSGKSGEVLFKVDGTAGSQLGWCVAGAGDIDGDGRADFVAGAPGEAQSTGAVHVYSGADGKELLVLRGEAAGDRFGTDARTVGDLDDDGKPELLIGAPKHDAAGQDAGRAYLFDGESGDYLHAFDGERAGDELGGGELAGFREGDHSLLVVAALKAGPNNGGRVYAWSGTTYEKHFSLDGDTGSVNLGWFVSIVGDVNADGMPDILATDWHDSSSGPGYGRVWVCSGKDGAVLHDLRGHVQGENFGIGSCEAGDLDGDGHDDLAIGAWQNSELAPSAGKVYLISGKTGQPMGTLTGRIPGDTLGFDATNIGDVDGDEVPDLLLTSAYNAAKGTKAGRTYVVSGASCLNAR
jgi:hypothetical protein